MQEYPVEIKIKTRKIENLEMVLEEIKKMKQLNLCIKAEIEVELQGVVNHSSVQEWNQDKTKVR